MCSPDLLGRSFLGVRRVDQGFMPTYHLMFKGTRDGKPTSSVSFEGEDPGEALLFAQRAAGVAELWVEDKFICTLERTGEAGELWVISGRPADKATDPQATDPQVVPESHAAAADDPQPA